MNDDDTIIQPPRRRINGVTWVWQGAYVTDVNGIVGRWTSNYGNEFVRAGFAMGCVKDAGYDREERLPLGQEGA